MRPVIGIPLRYQRLSDDRPILYIPERLRRSVQQAGGFVYAISPVQDVDYINTAGNMFNELTSEEKELIKLSVKACDGILFPGGIKFTPYDRYLLEVAIDEGIPVLGICLGMQMMSCYKRDINLFDVEGHKQESDDEVSHLVRLDEGSRLYQILGKSEIKVNSFHKRKIIDSGEYKIVGYSDDGIIEAIEYPGEIFNIGIQWHPEISYEWDIDSRKILNSFIEEASLRKSKQKISG